MSDKRSERLRSLIAATMNEAAEDAAPVTLTGSGMPASSGPVLVQADILPAVAVGLVGESVPPVRPKAELVTSQSIDATRSLSELDSVRVEEEHANAVPALFAPQRISKSASWEKANVTYEPRDRAILERSDLQARSYGFRIRKGGNPSLFVRAGLRLLDDLREREPETWIKHIAAVTSLELKNRE